MMFLMIEWIIIIIFLVFSLSLIVELYDNYIVDSKAIRNKEIIYFSYINSIQLENEKQIIVNAIDDNNACLIVNFYNDPFVYIVGNYEIVLKDNASATPFIVQGAGINKTKAGDLLSIGEIRRIDVPVIATTKQRSVFYHGRRIDLFDKYIVVLDYETYLEVFNFPFSLNYLHLYNPSSDQLKMINTEANADQLNISINRTEYYMINKVKEMFETGTVFLLLMILGFIFLLVHVFSCLQEMVSSKEEEFFINYIYGCTIAKIGLRIFFVAMPIFCVPALMIVLLFGTIIGYEYKLLLVICCICVVIAMAMAYYLSDEIRNDIVDAKIIN